MLVYFIDLDPDPVIAEMSGPDPVQNQTGSATLGATQGIGHKFKYICEFEFMFKTALGLQTRGSGHLFCWEEKHSKNFVSF